MGNKFTPCLRYATQQCTVCLCFGKKTAAHNRLDNRTYTALTKSQQQNKKCLACYSFNMSCPGNCDYISAKKCRGDLKHTAPAWNVDPAGPKSRTDLSGNNDGAKYTQEFWDKGPGRRHRRKLPGAGTRIGARGERNSDYGPFGHEMQKASASDAPHVSYIL